jgi:hypothetical protein
MGYLSKHHLYPKRFYRKQKKPAILFLCRTCHNEIERRIPYGEKLYREDYLEIARNFLAKGGKDERNRNAD